jgi:hypothetical protein
MGHHRDPWVETHASIQPSLTRRGMICGMLTIRGLKPTAKIRRHYATMEIPINSTVATRRGRVRHGFPCAMGATRRCGGCPYATMEIWGCPRKWGLGIPTDREAGNHATSACRRRLVRFLVESRGKPVFMPRQRQLNLAVGFNPRIGRATHGSRRPPNCFPSRSDG